jgi:hypothetical protein
VRLRRHWKKLWAVAGVVLVGACVLGLVFAIDAGKANASTRLVQPISSVVPQGQLLKVDVTDANGRHAGTYLIDPAAQRCVNVVADDEADPSRPYAAIVVYDSSGRAELDGTTLEVWETEKDSYARMQTKFDALGGQTVAVSGNTTINGVDTVVVEGERTSKDGKETVGFRAYVDSSSGLVVRQEISSGGEKVILSSKIIAADSEQFAEVTRATLRDLAATMASGRVKALTAVDYPVMVLPEGFNGLSLLALVPSGEGPDYIRLDYQTAKAPGRYAVAIRIWDLNAKSDYPVDMLLPLDQAKEEDLGSATRISFRHGDSAIQVMVEKEFLSVAASELARVLVPISQAGLN